MRLNHLCGFATACGGAAEHGTLSRLSATDAATLTLCEHEVPADACTRCHPELEASFREVGDWCGPHSVPESQCHRCHPDLEFTALPDLAEDADYAEISADDALAGLGPHLAAGKVTVVDFSAPWCAPCHNLEVHLRNLVAENPSTLAVRTITVAEWGGPLFDRYLSEAESLPFVHVYSEDGSLVGTLAGFEHDELDALLADALSE